MPSGSAANPVRRTPEDGLPAHSDRLWTLTSVPPTPDRVPYVRQQALAVLHSWHLDEIAWQVELLLSELVTNAVKHARTSFTVVMERVGRRLKCEVRDGNPRPPQPLLTQDAEETGGRGLLLVDRVSSNWGVTLHRQGKTVWFDLELDRAPGASEPPHH